MVDNCYGFPWFLKFAFTRHPHIASNWIYLLDPQVGVVFFSSRVMLQSKTTSSEPGQRWKITSSSFRLIQQQRKNSTLFEVRNFLCKFPLYIYFFLQSKISAFKMQAQTQANPVILVCQCSSHTWIISNGWACWRVQGVSGSTTHHGWRPLNLKTGWKAWFKYTRVRVSVSEKQPESRESHDQPQ